MRTPAFFILFILFSGFGASSASAQSSIEGDWIGTLTSGSYWTFIKVRFENKDKKYEVKFDVPEERIKNLSLKQLRLNPSSIYFEAQPDGDPGAWIFDGKLGNKSISGDFKYLDEKGFFQLVRRAPVNSKVFDQYTGDYQLEPDKYISIARYDPGNGENYLSYQDSESGYWGLLYPLSETTFYFAPARVSDFPLDLKITFVKDKGKITGLTQSREQLTQKKFAGKTALYEAEPVSFQNGDVILSGELIKPLRGSRHPAIVIVHGSGAQSREGAPSSPNYMRFIANNFARQGIAALIYDKRGVGNSTGDWNKASFDELADDVLAGVQFLKNRPDIDSRQIGLWGTSQAGWIMASAGSRSKDAAFIIVIGGGGVSPTEQELYRREKNLREAGFIETEIQKALAHQRLKFDLVRRNEALKLDAVNEETKNEKWFPYVSNPRSGQRWTYWSGIIDFDPESLWEKFDRPVLIVFGELDESSPLPDSANGIEQALKKGGNKDYTVKIFPRADHIVLVKPDKNGAVGYPHFATGYFKMVNEWLLKRVRPAK